jgi:hypothetical protein
MANVPIAIQHLQHQIVVSVDVVTYSCRLSRTCGLSAHLVEPAVSGRLRIDSSRLSCACGRKIVLTTPNARALVSHLEMYWLHFGHVAFYHPRLLCFFLQRVGFQNETWGENPAPAYPLSGAPSIHEPLGIEFEIPVYWEAVPTNRSLSKWRSFLRVRLARLLGLDDVIRQANTRLRQLAVHANRSHAEISRLASVMDRLDRPFECYVTAVKN